MSFFTNIHISMNYNFKFLIRSSSPIQISHTTENLPYIRDMFQDSERHSYFCVEKYLFYYFFFFSSHLLSTEYDLQFLHQLPSGLLQDILYERYEQPAFLDKDNVDEFRKVYDDFYGRNQPVTGRKKVPPTKPYVQLLMLYDLLKREAKKLMLNKFQVKRRTNFFLVLLLLLLPLFCMGNISRLSSMCHLVV